MDDNSLVFDFYCISCVTITHYYRADSLGAVLSFLIEPLLYGFATYLLGRPEDICSCLLVLLVL